MGASQKTPWILQQPQGRGEACQHLLHALQLEWGTVGWGWKTSFLQPAVKTHLQQRAALPSPLAQLGLCTSKVLLSFKPICSLEQQPFPKPRATPKHHPPQNGEPVPGYQGGANDQGSMEGCQAGVFMEPRLRSSLCKLPLSSWFPPSTFTMPMSWERVLTLNSQIPACLGKVPKTWGQRQKDDCKSFVCYRQIGSPRGSWLEKMLLGWILLCTM